ncbi:MAG: superoxide dismutase family protein [Eubacterium sp.]|nr:superoxide dismutase family protein [Eubacterium sp.]
MLKAGPQAAAQLRGSDAYESISGSVKFYKTANGVVVYAVVTGLPCVNSFNGFHIHEGGSCSGNADDPFADVMGHYNPKDAAHPNHAGDLPPLLNNNGNAISLFLTDRFNVEQIIGRTVIIHDKYDDFTTQPSGNSGKKIACGEIKNC